MEENELDIGVRGDGGEGVDSQRRNQNAIDQGHFPKTGVVQSYQSPDVEKDGPNPQAAESLEASYIGDDSNNDGKMWTYWNKAAVDRDGLEIQAPQIKEPWEYVVYVPPEVSKVLQEYDDEGDVSYLVSFTDDRVDEVSNEGC